MQFLVKSGSPEKQQTACMIVGVFSSRKLSPTAAALDKTSRGTISKILRSGDMDGKEGQTLMLHALPRIPCARVLLVGCGKAAKFDAGAYRKAAESAIKAVKQSGAGDAIFQLNELPVKHREQDWKLREAVVTAIDLLYTYSETKGKNKPDTPKLHKLSFIVAERAQLTAAKLAVSQGESIGKGVSLTKELGNLPGNICTPSYLASQAKALKKDNSTLKIGVLGETEMKKLGMGAFLSVSKGSDEPGKLITIEYQGAPKNSRPVVLVGKGITFDTGGISLKPGAAMDEMKYDMCGAATVLGTLKACAEMALPINVIGVIASAENMPSGRASKPGDIVTTMSGQTVEILNTDAEGRLVLCDALTYTERYKPAAVIDIATLTGACIVALGHYATGLLANNQALADELLAAGQRSGDRAWQLPLWEEYDKQLDSNFADMANIGGRSAGTITAACFLSRFTENLDWAHLDIAGVAWYSGKEKRASGRPVPLLIDYLMNRASAS